MLAVSRSSSPRRWNGCWCLPPPCSTTRASALSPLHKDVAPPRWTRQQLEHDRRRSIKLFREQRLKEPLEDYLEAFDQYRGVVEELLEETVDLAQLQQKAEDVLTNPEMLEVF